MQTCLKGNPKAWFLKLRSCSFLWFQNHLKNPTSFQVHEGMKPSWPGSDSVSEHLQLPSMHFGFLLLTLKRNRICPRQDFIKPVIPDFSRQYFSENFFLSSGIHSKVEWKIKRFPIYSHLHTWTASPTANITTRAGQLLPTKELRARSLPPQIHSLR